MSDVHTDSDQSQRIDPKGPAAWIRHYAVGFAMGSVEVIPGVSSGTVAFVTGIYARLLDAIRDTTRLVPLVLKRKFGEVPSAIKELDYGLVVPLLLGNVTGILTLAGVTEHALEKYPIQMAALFMGLIIGSGVVAWKLMKRPTKTSVLIAAIAAIAFFLFLGLVTETEPPSDAATSTISLWAYFGAGAIAVCAMILPGFSGAFLLVVIGMYPHFLRALNDRDLLAVGVFVLGCLIGLSLFTRLLMYLLERYHDILVAALIGLMIGSVRILWPWPNGTNSTELAAPTGNVIIPVVLFCAGFIVVALLGRVGALREEELPHPG